MVDFRKSRNTSPADLASSILKTEPVDQFPSTSSERSQEGATSGRVRRHHLAGTTRTAPTHQAQPPLCSLPPKAGVAPGCPAHEPHDELLGVDGDVLGFSWSLLNMPAGSGTALTDLLIPSPALTQDLSGV